MLSLSLLIEVSLSLSLSVLLEEGLYFLILVVVKYNNKTIFYKYIEKKRAFGLRLFIKWQAISSSIIAGYNFSTNILQFKSGLRMCELG